MNELALILALIDSAATALLGVAAAVWIVRGNN